MSTITITVYQEETTIWHLGLEYTSKVSIFAEWDV